jgi:iron complex transport system substrate-binding protein
MILIGIIVSLGVVVMACAPQLTAVPPTSAPTAASPVTAATTPSSITLTDDAGRRVTLNAIPQRIVSLAPSTTEIAFALGIGNRIIAADTFSDYPAEAKNLPKIKTYPLSFEQVVSLQPDLVLAAGIQSQDDIKKLSDLKLNVLVVGSSKATFDGVMADIQLVGKATGTDAQAQSIVDGMKQKIDRIKAIVATATSKPRVYWELDATDPTKPYTPGPGSFVDDIITLAGGQNVAANAKSPYAQINAEEIIAANPDVIILSDAAYGITVDSVKARGGWGAINAVKNDKVLPIDDNLVSRPGPRIVDGLEAAARLIHPELFR